MAVTLGKELYFELICKEADKEIFQVGKWPSMSHEDTVN